MCNAMKLNLRLTLPASIPLRALLIVLLPLVCVGGVSVYPAHLRLPAIAVIGAICVLYCLKAGRLRLDPITLPMAALCGFLLISAIYSIDVPASLRLFGVYLVGFLLLLTDLREPLLACVIRVFLLAAGVIAVSILLSVMIDDLMLTWFSFLMNPRSDPLTAAGLRAEIGSANAYSGLAGERADAAYILNVGIAVLMAKAFARKPLRAAEYLLLALLASALIFTNKRMLFVIPFLMLAVFFLIMPVRYRLIRCLCVLLIAGAGLFVLWACIPALDPIFARFLTFSDGDFLSGRGELWEYAAQMLAERPLFGFGFGSFNAYAYAAGLRADGGRWDYYAHNCYIELPGEAGLVGSLLFAAAFARPLLYTFKLLTRGDRTADQRQLLLFALYVQIMFWVYSLSGNVLYYPQQIILWFFAIAAVNAVRRQRPAHNGGSL